MKNILVIHCLVISFLLFLNTACNDKKGEKIAAEPGYVQEIRDWQNQRLASLKKPDGWLSLIGLYWLETGENTFGTDSSQALVFPKGVPQMGIFTWEKNRVFMTPASNVDILLDGKKVTEKTLIWAKGMAEMRLHFGTLNWHVIERSGKVAVRLRDSENPDIVRLKKITNYPIDAEWRVRATLMPYEPPKKKMVRNVLGMETEQIFPGQLRFELGGKTHALEAIESGDELFIIFSDETSGVETYGACRYLYAKKPGADGKTILDFNKAHNPPCAYTNFATCPLPPLQNHLELAVTAGEKDDGFLKEKY